MLASMLVYAYSSIQLYLVQLYLVAPMLASMLVQLAAKRYALDMPMRELEGQSFSYQHRGLAGSIEV